IPLKTCHLAVRRAGGRRGGGGDLGRALAVRGRFRIHKIATLVKNRQAECTRNRARTYSLLAIDRNVKRAGAPKGACEIHNPVIYFYSPWNGSFIKIVSSRSGLVD